VAAGEVEMPG
jgi:hypothetical protein